MRYALVVLVLLVAPLASCGDDPSAPSNAPEDHTLVRDGVAHKPGLDDPVTQCAACHGSDLRGGDSGEPSCFQCHGRKW